MSTLSDVLSNNKIRVLKIDDGERKFVYTIGKVFKNAGMISDIVWCEDLWTRANKVGFIIYAKNEHGEHRIWGTHIDKKFDIQFDTLL